MRDAQIRSVLQDKPVMEELMERIESDRGLPDAERFGVKRDMLRSVIGQGNPTEEDFDTRPLTEAIILLNGRPSLLIKNDTFEIPKIDKWRTRLLPARSGLERAIRSIGRLELVDSLDFEWVGTAWMVGERIAVTNRHVAQTFAERKGQGFAFARNLENKPIGARIDFKEEYRQPASVELVIEKILHVEDDGASRPDLAIVQLAKSSALPKPIALSGAALSSGREVAVIGYPARDSRNDQDAMVKVFGDIYEVKRLAPGLLTKAAAGEWFFNHDCSTLGGNSGSAVIDVETGEALGLHFGGRFRRANYAVRADVVLKALKKLKVSVAVPGPGGEAALADLLERARARVPSDYANRAGYDPAFLGAGAALAVPLPKLGANAADAAIVTGAPERARNVLRYTHFSIVVSKPRRLPLLTAVNIDGKSLRRVARKGDTWLFDPRLAEGSQAGPAVYANNDLDRGHMVRRLDPVWGTEAEARQANDDTFHFTNACPQHKDLNQKTWNDLEDYILDNAGALDLRVCVFTGPVLRGDDPRYRGIQLPREFWKVAALVNADTGKLSATGYLLSQARMIADLSEFVFGRFRTYQVPIGRIERLTKLNFGKLADVDPLAGREAVEEVPGAAVGIAVDGPEDIVFG